MQHWIDRFKKLPRAAKWAAAALAFFTAYFAIIEPALDATARYAARADTLQSALVRANQRARGSAGLAADLKLGTARFGDKLSPWENPGSGALNKRISDVLGEHGVSAWTSDERRAANLPRDTFEGLLAPDERARRIVVDLDFESHPIIATRVIADLERAPEVHAISRLTLRKVDNQKRNTIAVNTSVETWTVAKERAR